jgi:hypothetical protein
MKDEEVRRVSGENQKKKTERTGTKAEKAWQHPVE